MNITNPYFSIIIPTLNEEKYLPSLLKDLYLQTNKDFEVVVVDAKSSDKTQKNALSYSSKIPLSLLISSQKNVCVQRNLGAKKATGKWLIFMDADNRIPNYFLQGIRYQIDKYNPKVFTTFVSPDGNHPLDKTITQVINTVYKTQKNTIKPTALESLIGIKQTDFLHIKGFNPNIKWSEGSEMMSRLKLKKNDYHAFNEPRYTYSLRRIRKEGTLKIIRNISPLILARQTGLKLEDKMYEKLYPMLGGDFFNSALKPSNTFEQIIKDLDAKYQVTNKLDKIKKPFKKRQNIIKKLLNRLPVN